MPDECELKHIPLEKDIEGLRRDISRLELEAREMSKDLWEAINSLREVATRLERSVATLNAKMAIISITGGALAQLFVKFLFKG
jgi:hypothetical protein